MTSLSARQPSAAGSLTMASALAICRIVSARKLQKLQPSRAAQATPNVNRHIGTNIAPTSRTTQIMRVQDVALVTHVEVRAKGIT